MLKIDSLSVLYEHFSAIGEVVVTASATAPAPAADVKDQNITIHDKTC